MASLHSPPERSQKPKIRYLQSLNFNSLKRAFLIFSNAFSLSWLNSPIWKHVFVKLSNPPKFSGYIWTLKKSLSTSTPTWRADRFFVQQNLHLGQLVFMQQEYPYYPQYPQYPQYPNWKPLEFRCPRGVIFPNWESGKPDPLISHHLKTVTLCERPTTKSYRKLLMLEVFVSVSICLFTIIVIIWKNTMKTLLQSLLYSQKLATLEGFWWKLGSGED